MKFLLPLIFLIVIIGTIGFGILGVMDVSVPQKATTIQINTGTSP
jgi:uncharacterized membrane protein YuzA (DUF378 family)